MEEERTLRAVLFRLKQGREQFEKVKMIRLKGKDINYLLMLDHMPVIGELDGDMTIVSDDEYEFHHIRGFFHLKNNEFHFLQKDDKEKKE